MKKLGFVGVALAAVAISTGCGGGGSSTPPAPAPVVTASPSPSPSPTPGQVQVAYTTTFGASGSAANASNISFQAPTQTAAVTVTQSGFSGPFTSSSACGAITLPASSASGAFTVTAADTTATTNNPSATCKVTFTGATGFGTGTLTATVPKPAGVVLRWYTPNYATQSPPIPVVGGPINIVGTGALYNDYLQISELNYIGGFASANVTASAGCGGTPPFATIAADATPPPGLPTAAPGSSIAYYTVTGVNAIATSGGCSISAADSYAPLAPATPNPAATIGVSITTSTGTFQ